MRDYQSYTAEDGRRYLSVCICPGCARVTSELYELECPCGHIYVEYGLTIKELIIATSPWN